jgi:hypothetical protein
VLHAVACEVLRAAVIHEHRESNGKLALGHAQAFPQIGIQMDVLRRTVELL